MATTAFSALAIEEQSRQTVCMYYCTYCHVLHTTFLGSVGVLLLLEGSILRNNVVHSKVTRSIIIAVPFVHHLRDRPQCIRCVGLVRQIMTSGQIYPVVVSAAIAACFGGTPDPQVRPLSAVLLLLLLLLHKSHTCCSHSLRCTARAPTQHIFYWY